MSQRMSFLPLMLVLLVILLGGINIASSRSNGVLFPENMGVERVGGVCAHMSGCKLSICEGRCGFDAKNAHCIGDNVCCCER
ncbi:unnamed protein product [Amaranthus hypochondriacus]